MLTPGQSGEKRFSYEIIRYIKQGKTEEIARLLQHCDVNSRIDDEGSTLLHLSVKKGTVRMTCKKDLEMIKILLRFGADKNMKNRLGLTPFDVAFLRRQYEMMQLLLPDNDYDWTGLDHSDGLSIYYAFTVATKEMMALFLQRCRVDFTVKDAHRGKTPLHCLAQNDNKGVWEYCRHLKFDVDAQDKDGRTALHLAFPRIEAVRFLLERGARMDILNNSVRPPVLNNCYKWNVFQKPKEYRECLDLLLYYGLDAQSTDDKGSSMISLYHEHAERRFFRSNHEYVFKPILAHLAMLEVVNGLSIKPLIVKHINANDKLIYESCKEELEKMKTMVVFGYVKFFKLLAANEYQITQYARNEEIFEKIVQIDESSKCYYFRHLRIRFLEARRFNDLRNKAAKVVGEVMNVHYQNYVVDYIVSYLNKNDLKLFA